MALGVSDVSSSDSSGIRLTLQNTTDIEIVFLIGKKSFTLKSGQSKLVRAEKKTSIEARPNFIGIESGFIVGGVKKDSSISCALESSDKGPRSLVLDFLAVS